MKKIIVIFAIITLFFTINVVSEKSVQRVNKEIYSTTILDNVPNWEIGNYWKYNAQYEGDISSVLSYIWTFEELLFTVDEISGNYYFLTISGALEGEMTIYDVQVIRGELVDTTITGTCKVDKSNNGISEIDATIQGKLSIANIPIKSFTMIFDLSFTPSYNSVSFPISVDKRWTIPISEYHGTVILSLLNNPIYIDENIGGESAECTGTEIKTVQAGTYNSYRIISSGDVEEYYYAPDAGNVIKALGTVANNVDVTLLSTNFDSSTPGAPNKPSRPSGPTTISPGQQYTYSSSTTDNEGDQIYYLFSWGDNSDSGWIGPYNSGAVAEASHSWSNTGSYSVKVKAKDVEGHESEWSDPLSVSTSKLKIINNFRILKFLRARFTFFLNNFL